jgi:Cys-rich protein (TIGR01571 family)
MAAAMVRLLLVHGLFLSVCAERMWSFDHDAERATVSASVNNSKLQAVEQSMDSSLKSNMLSVLGMTSKVMLGSFASIFENPTVVKQNQSGSADDSAQDKSESLEKEVKEVETEIEVSLSKWEIYPAMPHKWNFMRGYVSDATFQRMMVAIDILIVAIIYRLLKPAPTPDENPTTFDFSEWSSGTFDCFQDLGICCTACCCPAVRWSQTVDMAGVVKYWIGIALMIIATVVCPCAACGAMIGGRIQLRKKYGMKNAADCGTVCGDAIMILCCTCCVIAQEARHVEAAARAGITGEPVIISAPKGASIQEAPASAPQQFLPQAQVVVPAVPVA